MGEKQIVLDADTIAVQWTESARETLTRMGERVGALARAFGEDSPQAAKAAMSYVQVMTNLHGWGDVAVSKDGDLSLFCATRTNDGRPAGFVFGIIWHEDRRRCLNEGCEVFISPEGKPYWFASKDKKSCAGEHNPSVPLGLPMPGTWSFHS